MNNAVPIKPDLTDLWNVESVGIRKETTDDTKAMEQLKSRLEIEVVLVHGRRKMKRQKLLKTVNLSLYAKIICTTTT